MMNDIRIRLSYKLLITWRKLVYRRILLNSYLSNFSTLSLTVFAVITRYAVCLVNSNDGKTIRYMRNWQQQTSAIFSPEITPMAVYAKSTTEARIALDSTDFGTAGKVIFFTHGAYLIQNISSVLAEIAFKSERPYVNVLVFRRQEYPHVERWWKAYALCFRINVEIVHHDTLLLIGKVKDTLRNNGVVLCGPDYFFSSDIAYQDALEKYRKTAALFLRMAKSTESNVLYVKCCSHAVYENVGSVLCPIKQYDAVAIEALFEKEILDNAEEWFFSYNHYKSMKAWNHNVV